MNVFKLPVELMRDIFELATFTGGEVDARTRLSLMSVCSRFAYVAVDHPGLWARFVFPQVLPYRELSVWAERARRHPRHIEIRCSPGSLSEWDAVMMKGFVYAGMPICRSLIVYPCAHFLLPALSCPAPILHDVQLWFCDHIEGGDGYQCGYDVSKDVVLPLSFFPNSANLHHASVSNGPLTWPATPFAGLAYLNLSFPSDEHYLPSAFNFLSVLSGCVLLKVLHLNNLRFNRNDITADVGKSVSLFELPSLTSLSLIGRTLENLATFVPGVSAPRLEELVFHEGFNVHPVASDIPHAPAFFSNLRVLAFLHQVPADPEWHGPDIGTIVLREELIMAVLQQTPRVLQVTIIVGILSDEFMRALIFTGDDGVKLLPHLQSFHLTHCRGFSDDSLLTMVKSRLDPAAADTGLRSQLADVKLPKCRNVGVEAIRELEALFNNSCR